MRMFIKTGRFLNSPIQIQHNKKNEKNCRQITNHVIVTSRLRMQNLNLNLKQSYAWLL